MKVFRCTQCQHVLYFEGTRCLGCQSELNFLPDLQILSAVEPVSGRAGNGTGSWQVLGDVQGAQASYRRCANQVQHGLCNWAIPAASASDLCVACELNGQVPDPTDPSVLVRWQQMEAAKRRLLYSLQRLGLGYSSKAQDPQNGLRFDFLADGQQKVLTGHAHGVITINLSEADPSYREQARERLGEVYRTLLGHFRHESGHYFWDRIFFGGERIDAFRDLFGDERADYAKALQDHYAVTPGTVRTAGFVSAYAQMHPWEDWAETWAHYLHMVDTLETARAYGLAIHRNVGEPVEVANIVMSDFDQLLRGWIPVTLALNSLNRSMGQVDPYPFALDDGMIAKLRFVHDVVAGQRNKGSTVQRPAPLPLLEQSASLNAG